MKQENEMDNRTFIVDIFSRILFREPSNNELQHFEYLLDNKYNRELLIYDLYNSHEAKNIIPNIKNNEFVPTGHFYSAIPSYLERMEFINHVVNDAIYGIVLSKDEHILFLSECKQYYLKQPFCDYKTNGFRYYFKNPAYSYHDGLILHFMMLRYKPHRYFEIGSGFSSCMALDTNQYFFNNEIQTAFIEPYPELLLSLITENDKKQIKLFPHKLQSIPIDEFKQLEENDILFIDSTHVAKLGSDVNYLFNNILPILKKGVLIHIHDIFWPFEYPQEWIKEGRAWNELYILRNFLMYNDHFKIIYFADFMYIKNQEWLIKNMPLVLKDTGGNFWMQKIK